MRATGTSEAVSARPSQPTRGETARDLEHYVSEVTQFFDWARGGATAWAASQALMHLTERACRNKYPRPSREQRDRMVSAITRARPHISRQLENERISEVTITFGLDAAQGLAMLWAEGDVERAERHPHIALDLIAHARILSSDLLSATLFRGIETRAEQRRRDDVTKLRPLLDEHCA